MPRGAFTGFLEAIALVSCFLDKKRPSAGCSPAGGLPGSKNGKGSPQARGRKGAKTPGLPCRQSVISSAGTPRKVFPLVSGRNRAGVAPGPPLDSRLCKTQSCPGRCGPCTVPVLQGFPIFGTWGRPAVGVQKGFQAAPVRCLSLLPGYGPGLQSFAVCGSYSAPPAAILSSCCSRAVKRSSVSAC